MSKKNLLYIVIIALLIFLNFLLAGNGDKIQIGEPVTLTSSLMISDIYVHPEIYLDKYIRIEGTIQSINKESRCSFVLKDLKGNLIYTQCSGCNYVLSNDLKDKKCTVQGILHRIKMNFSCDQLEKQEMLVLNMSSNKGFEFQKNDANLYYLDSIGIIIE